MVLPKCGEGSAGFNVSASYDEVDHSFNFGRLSATDGLLAMIYKVCWCQPRADRGHKCDSPSELPSFFHGGKCLFLSLFLFSCARVELKSAKSRVAAEGSVA